MKEKTCIVCGQVFTDRTRPGNAKVCSPECRKKCASARALAWNRANRDKYNLNMKRLYWRRQHEGFPYPKRLEEISCVQKKESVE
jgi:hypothetical protein